jgi:hypothetical protein
VAQGAVPQTKQTNKQKRSILWKKNLTVPDE